MYHGGVYLSSPLKPRRHRNKPYRELRARFTADKLRGNLAGRVDISREENSGRVAIGSFVLAAGAPVLIKATRRIYGGRNAARETGTISRCAHDRGGSAARGRGRVYRNGSLFGSQ